MYESVRDALIQSYPWNFAMKRATLAPLGTTPAWGYLYEYQLPSDCLAPFEVSTSGSGVGLEFTSVEYKIEGGKILTDEGTAINLRYISRISDEGEMTALFAEVFATQLAYEACEEVTQSNTKKQLLMDELRKMIDIGYRSDAIEQPPDTLPEDEWITERY
jgi:hypothetical protein